MALSVSLEDGRASCLDSIEAFLRAARSVSEYDLLGASLCHGWSRLDVVSHVLAGWQEMLAGMASRVNDAPSVDAATYWRAFAEVAAGEDPVAALMWQRRRTAAFTRPSSVLAQLVDVSDAVRRAVMAFQEGTYLWQRQTFAAGDFLAVWAVENVVHHLDLRTEEPAPANGLALTRRTVESLIGQSLPSTLSDVDAALVGGGRQPAPEQVVGLDTLLPALG